MTPDPRSYLELLKTNCRACGHSKLNHAVSRGKRMACCHGDAKSICTCRKFVGPEGSDARA
jgi:hypothetical protein